MNTGELSIAVRERNIAELYDLSLLVCRRYWWQLGLLICLPYFPFALLNGLLFYRGATNSLDFNLIPYMVLLAEIPLITAPATVFLGNALFHGNCDIRHCFAQAYKHIPALIVYGLLKIFIMLTPAQMVEIFTLEQLKQKRAWKRGLRLMSGWRQDNLAQLLINTGLIALAFFLGAICLSELSALFFHANNPLAMDIEELGLQKLYIFDLEHSLTAYVFFIPLIIYFSTVRFLSYINLRTVREGWSTELQIKHAAQSLRSSQS